MHVGTFDRGKGRFMMTEYVPTDERTGPRYPLILTTGRILSQYNVGAQTRRTENSTWHSEDILEINPFDAEHRGIKDGNWVMVRSRAGETALRALITDRVATGVVYTTFHHPLTQANVITTDFSDWATNCPEYKVTAVEVLPSNGPSTYQQEYEDFSDVTRRIGARRGCGVAPMTEAATRVPSLRVSKTGAEDTSRLIPEEVPVALVYDGSTHAVMMATPADLEDFAVGFSFTEGIIKERSEIREFEVVEHEKGLEARMWLVPQSGRTHAERRATRLPGRLRAGFAVSTVSKRRCRTPGASATRLPSLQPKSKRARGHAAGATINIGTRAVHAAAFWDSTAARIAALREDVGRHNALDKLVGAVGARQGSIPPRGLSFSPAVSRSRWCRKPP